MGVGQRAVASRNESLDGMHQRIDAGTGGKEWVHAQGGFRIDQRDIRHGCLADDGELHPLLLIGNDHELRDIRRGAGGSRNQNQRRAGHAKGVYSFEFINMPPVSSDDADALGAIHRTATTDCDDHVAAFAAIQLGAEHHLFAARIWGNASEQAVLNILPIKACLHVRHPASLDDAWVRHHQHLSRTKVGGAGADTMAAARPKDDFRGDEFALEADIRAHDCGLFYFL